MQHEMHGLSKTKAYRHWIYMKARCYNPRASKYELYGGRGIAVCDRWRNSFANFYADMGDPPPRHTLDRIDGTKGYSPDNCRWATHKEQSRNLRTNVRINGEFASDIAKRAGVTRNTVEYRHRKGLPVDAPPITARNTCKAGHEWNDENTYLATVKRKQGGTRTQRFCRACRAEHQAALRERRKSP